MAGVRAGRSEVLVVRGEAGAGKTALLEYLLERASGCQVARAAGVEAEAELPFAGLHQLCAPFLDRLGRLPGPQRDALGAAFSLRDGNPPDRFVAGLAVLSLLCEVAGNRPLVCVVDDAQWLDRPSAQALGFVANHLAAAPVALVFAARPPAGGPDAPGLSGLTGRSGPPGLAELSVRGLPDGDARALLEAAVPGLLGQQIRDRIVAETRGNPGALRELARGLTPGELAAGFGVPGGPALPGRSLDRIRQRLAPLPPATRLLLLVAAAEPARDPVLVWRAAGQLGAGEDAAAPAAAAGLIEPGGQVRFSDPLTRYALYQAASPQERQRAHRALAEAISPATDLDRRAWHRAHAVPGLDEDAAAELERTVGQAQARGGLAAAAAFRGRAAELTYGRARRAQRALAAAGTNYQAGAPTAALRLLAMAQAGPLGKLGSARAELVGARLAADSGQDRDAAPLLLKAARRLEPLDPGLAREACRDAFSAALKADRLAGRGATAGSRRGRTRGAAGPGAGACPRSAAVRAGCGDRRRLRRRRATAQAGAYRISQRGNPHRGGIALAAARVPDVPRSPGRREPGCALGPADRTGPIGRRPGRAPGRAAGGRDDSAARGRARGGRLDGAGGGGGHPGDG